MSDQDIVIEETKLQLRLLQDFATSTEPAFKNKAFYKGLHLIEGATIEDETIRLAYVVKSTGNLALTSLKELYGSMARYRKFDFGKFCDQYEGKTRQDISTNTP